MSGCTQKAPNLRFCFLKRLLTNTPRRHRLADGQLASPHPPSPSFSSFGSASVVLCCFSPTLSNTALPMVLLYHGINRVPFPSRSSCTLYLLFSCVRRADLPCFLPTSLPPSSPLPRFLLPSLLHILHLGPSRQSALSYRPSFIPCPPSCIPAARSSRE